jgi:hypothetical protein
VPAKILQYPLVGFLFFSIFFSSLCYFWLFMGGFFLLVGLLGCLFGLRSCFFCRLQPIFDGFYSLPPSFRLCFLVGGVNGGGGGGWSVGWLEEQR